MGPWLVIQISLYIEPSISPVINCHCHAPPINNNHQQQPFTIITMKLLCFSCRSKRSQSESSQSKHSQSKHSQSEHSQSEHSPTQDNDWVKKRIDGIWEDYEGLQTRVVCGRAIPSIKKLIREAESLKPKPSGQLIELYGMLSHCYNTRGELSKSGAMSDMADKYAEAIKAEKQENREGGGQALS